MSYFGVKLIDLKKIEQAANRLNSVIIRTPLISSSHLDNLSKGKVLLKAENLQRTGSFKIRGAYNLLSQLSKDEKNSGAVAYSSGNHAQAVAASGKILNIETTIVMPEDTPQIKVDNTKKLNDKNKLIEKLETELKNVIMLTEKLKEVENKSEINSMTSRIQKIENNLKNEISIYKKQLEENNSKLKSKDEVIKNLEIELQKQISINKKLEEDNIPFYKKLVK